MTIIGNNVDAGTNVKLDDNTAYAHKVSTMHTTFTVAQKVTDYHVRQNSSSLPNKNITIGIYDVSSGVDGAILVAGTEQSFTSDNASQYWHDRDTSADNITIPAGTYGLIVWSDGWPGGYDKVYVNGGAALRQNALGALPDPFTTNTTAYSAGSFSVYVDTVDAVAATIPEITALGSDDPIDTGDSIIINGKAFLDPKGSGTAKLSLVDDVNDASAVILNTTQWFDTLVVADVVLPTGTQPSDDLYVFITNDNGDTNVSGYLTSAIPLPSDLHTVTLEDGAGNPVICTSTDFALGMTFSKQIDGDAGNVEFATDVVAVSGIDTDTPQFSMTWPTGIPVAPDNFIVTYDQEVGDIKASDGLKAMPSGEVTGIICT